MKCPYCGGEMERGHVMGPRGVFWSKEVRNFFFFPHTAKGDIVIAGAYQGASGENSHVCRKCNRIIIELYTPPSADKKSLIEF